MKKKQIWGCILVALGILGSWGLHVTLRGDGLTEFLQGGIFRVIGMPVACTGAVLIILSQQNSVRNHLDIFGKLLLFALLLIYLVATVFVLITEIIWKQ